MEGPFHPLCYSFFHQWPSSLLSPHYGGKEGTGLLLKEGEGEKNKSQEETKLDTRLE